MKIKISLSLILLSLLIIEAGVNWFTRELDYEGYKYRFIDTVGVADVETLKSIKRDNPQWVSNGLGLSKVLVRNEFSVTALGITQGYKNRTIDLLSGGYYLNGGVLLSSSMANELYRSDDVLGSPIVINSKEYTVTGIFRIKKKYKFMIEEPAIICSLLDENLGFSNLNYLSIANEFKISNELSKYIPEPGSLVEYNRILGVIWNSSNLIQGLVVAIVFFSLLSYLIFHIKSRINLYRELLRYNYTLEAIRKTVFYEPLLYLIPLSICVLSIFTVKFPSPYFSYPLFSFFPKISATYNPEIGLIGFWNIVVHYTILLVTIPGGILLTKSSNCSYKDLLLIPICNILFSILLYAIGIELVWLIRGNIIITIYIFSSMFLSVNKKVDFI